MTNEAISVYSVEYNLGRSMTTKRMWFANILAADQWIKEPVDYDGTPMRWSPRNITGPHTHVVTGKKGLVSILRTYA